MPVELPEFKKCCLCLPLRGGLLGWAYFKIIVNAIITLMLAYFILTALVLSLYGGSNNESHVLMMVLYGGLILILFFLFVTDFIAALVFIVAGHKKNEKVIRGYFVYNIGVLIVTILLIVGAAGIAIAKWISSESAMYLVVFAAFCLTFLLQVYYTLLVRSAALELESSGEFQFVNNSGETPCMMTNKEKNTEAENV